MSEALLKVRNLRIAIRTTRGLLPVVRGVDFDIQAGEIIGLAGESGCGKTLTALATMGLLPARGMVVEADRMWLGSHDLRGLPESNWRKLRGSSIAMVFQDPASALDPVFTIGHQVAFASRHGHKGKGKLGNVKRNAMEALESVGFSQPEKVFRAYPHELSGGMRQLVMIAMAIAARPSILLADEPTTALDVTTQARVLQLLKQMRDRYDTGVLLISHDLSVISQCAETAMVMYAGHVVEQAACSDLFALPGHPYTAGLLGALPRIEKAGVAPVRPIPGQVPAPGAGFSGCPFEPRCQHRDEDCRDSNPRRKTHRGHSVACHHPL